jgi:MoaA/NifB/PqqE/SkfB family radical SAM enzyme
MPGSTPRPGPGVGTSHRRWPVTICLRASHPLTALEEIDCLDPARSIAVLLLLPDCDMACRFCGSEEDFTVMSPHQAEGLLRVLQGHSVRNVVFGGGEPILWPHGLVRLSELARDLGFLVQVSTSGAALPPGFEKISAIDRYILPLEAMDSDVHDRLRRYPGGGHHARVLDSVEKLVQASKEFTVSTVVTRENIELLPGIASFLDGLHAGGAAVHAWHLYRFLPIGRAGRRAAGSLSVPYDDYLEACRPLKAREMGFPVYRRVDIRRSRSVEYFWYEGVELKIGSRVMLEASLKPDGAG